MSPKNRRRHAVSIHVQELEDRRVLAAFGTPWPDARDLTISFPSDGVQVGKYQNDINELLDQTASRQEWQELVARAYQTWAIHADINVGLRSDYDLPFGTPGLSTNDPRFGEFRIGAFPQQGLLASSVPFQAVAGTYSGDILLNSNQQFRYHDWDGGLAPDTTTWGEDDRDLFSLLLHEVGNTLGVADSDLEWTVMFRAYTVPKGILTAEDIAAVQALYGARTDPYEQIDNGQLNVATLVPTPVGFDPSSDVIRTRASLLDGSDVDVFQVVPVTGMNQATIRLRAAGISLLQSHLEVLDESGVVLHSVAADSIFDNDLTIELSGLQDHDVLFIRVSAADPADIYSFGDYFVEIDYRAPAVQASDPNMGAYDAGPGSLLTHFGLRDDELGGNDSILDAVIWGAQTSVSPNRYEIESSLSASNDVDYYKVTAPTEVDGRLVVHVASVGLDAPEVRVRVVDAAGNAVGTAGRLRADGTWTVEVAQPNPEQDYFIRISVDPGSVVGVGNYVAVAEFEAPAEQMKHLSSGVIDDSADKFITWTATKTKLYRFDLIAGDADPDQAIRLTIYDAHTKEVALVLVTNAGNMRSALGWLQRGEYILRFTAVSPQQTPVTSISYSLLADGISDDQDENEEMSDEDGIYEYIPYYYYGPDPLEEDYYYDYEYEDEYYP